MVKQKPCVQSCSDHLNGLAVRSLSTPNMPSTIIERASQKSAAAACRKSDSVMSLTGCGVWPSSVTSAQNITTANGHPVSHLPQSLSKSNTANSYEVPCASACATHDSKKKLESNGGQCLKQNKASCCSRTLSDSCEAKTLSEHKIHKHPSSGTAQTATEPLEHSPSKLNCCPNLHKNNSIKTSCSSSPIHSKESVVRSSLHCKSVGVTDRMRKRDKKTKTLSASSTTNWRVMTYPDGDILPSLHNKVNATAAWHVKDIANKSSSVPTSSGDSGSVVQQSDTTAVCNEAVRGGRQHMMNGNSVLHDKTSNEQQRQTVNCTYHYTSLVISF